MSSSSSAGANRSRVVRRRQIQGERATSPIVFNERDYQVGGYLTGFSYFFPMGHGPYNVVQRY